MYFINNFPVYYKEHSMPIIPDNFVRFMQIQHGENGLAWLARLPDILVTCEQRWHIKLGIPFANLSYHYVISGTRDDGTHVVVKAFSPTGEFALQAEALHLFGGRGSVRLLDDDPTNEVQLLEYAEPGTLLSTLEDDEKAISIATSVMRQLWRPVPSGSPFPTILKWGAGLVRLRRYYDGGTGPFPARLVEEAETLFAELSTSMAEPMLLHGDLHQENILAAGHERWLAIDPKGLIGEPAYEIGPLLHNPFPQLLMAPQPGRILARRIDQLSEELSFDRARVRGWGLHQALLASWWDVEDTGQHGEGTLRCAELLSALKV
jgi:streptomycin 6-kinase